jgi:hypothetical protein
MTLLTEFLDKVKTDDRVEILRQLCDKIVEEEKLKDQWLPRGPNIFLSLAIYPDDIKYPEYVTLEREFKDSFVMKHLKGTTKMVVEAVKIEKIKPEDILVEFVKFYKHLRGE